MKKAALIIIGCLLMCTVVAQQQYTISGTVRLGDEPAANATVSLQPVAIQKLSTDNGFFRFSKITPGNYQLVVSVIGYQPYHQNIQVEEKNIALDINLTEKDTSSLAEVVVISTRNESVSGKLRDVAGTTINAGKKTEVINMKNINANLATNNTRQIYARIPGLNIWEYDRGGLQLGIGGRGSES